MKLNNTKYTDVLSTFSYVFSLLSEEHQVVSEILAISGEVHNFSHMHFVHFHI